jgi:hypothetical protein
MSPCIYVLRCHAFLWHGLRVVLTFTSVMILTVACNMELSRSGPDDIIWRNIPISKST